MGSTLYSCHILMKIEFSRQIFERSSNIKFYENLSPRSTVLACRPTGGRTDVTYLIVDFRILRTRLINVHHIRRLGSHVTQKRSYFQ